MSRPDQSLEAADPATRAGRLSGGCGPVDGDGDAGWQSDRDGVADGAGGRCDLLRDLAELADDLGDPTVAADEVEVVELVDDVDKFSELVVEVGRIQELEPAGQAVDVVGHGGEAYASTDAAVTGPRRCRRCGVELPARRPGQKGRPAAQCRSCAKATRVSSKKVYEHGSHACYVLNRCRCDRCRQANRDYERERAARITPSYVSAGPAREHIQMLAEHGVGLKQVARLSGVSHGTLSKLVYGMPDRPPSRRVRPSTAARILAVMPSQATDGTKVPAGPTWRLLDEMIAAGVPKSRIAEALGQKGPQLQVGRVTVTARNARAVRDLHRRWRAGEVEFARRDRWGASTVVVPPPARRGGADVSDLLVELAEIVEERNEQAEWRADAACRGRPTWMWFPGRGDHQTLHKALQVCGSCLVREQCRAANLHQRDGVYGGMSARQRRERRAEDAA